MLDDRTNFLQPALALQAKVLLPERHALLNPELLPSSKTRQVDHSKTAIFSSISVLEGHWSRIVMQTHFVLPECRLQQHIVRRPCQSLPGGMRERAFFGFLFLRTLEIPDPILLEAFHFLKQHVQSRLVLNNFVTTSDQHS